MTDVTPGQPYRRRTDGARMVALEEDPVSPGVWRFYVPGAGDLTTAKADAVVPWSEPQAREVEYWVWLFGDGLVPGCTATKEPPTELHRAGLHPYRKVIGAKRVVTAVREGEFE